MIAATEDERCLYYRILRGGINSEDFNLFIYDLLK